MGVFFYNTLMPTYFKMETISYVSSFKASSTFASISNFPRLLKVCAALSSFKSECHKEGGGETLELLPVRLFGRRGIVEQSREWATCPSEPRGQVHLLLIILPSS